MDSNRDKLVVWFRVCQEVDEAESRGIREAHAMEPGSLFGGAQLIGGPGDGRGPDVNHMGWYRLRARVARIMLMVWRWEFGCRTVLHEMTSE